MESMEAIEKRHSVRQYTDKKIDAVTVAALQREIDDCNKESGLHIQMVTDDPAAFNGMMARYGKFSGVQNYIAVIGRKSSELENKCGYYGERIVLLAQLLGLNTCWVAMTFSKGAAKKRADIKPGEKLAIVIAVGYGETQGVPHKSKSMKELCEADGEMPDWFRSGMEAAMLAPTAVNQQKFRFSLKDDTVRLESLGGFYSQIDLGIVKYHFELGSGRKVG